MNAIIVIRQRAKYFFDSFLKRVRRVGLSCPSCGHERSEVVDKKAVVTELVRCGNCKLLYRTPTTSSDEFRRFYQDNYRQGFTTDMPDALSLEAMKRALFRGTEKDYSGIIEILRRLGCKNGDYVLDYGCSWGYGSWQFERAGFLVSAFEVSAGRSEFARNELGVKVHHDESEIAGPYDVFFTSHVLEHIPEIGKVLALARRVVRPGGWFVALTPNGSSAHRKRDPEGWYRSWGFLHPLLLDEEFYCTQFGREAMLLASSPFPLEPITSWAREPKGQKVLDLDGGELLLIARLGVGTARPSSL